MMPRRAGDSLLKDHVKVGLQIMMDAALRGISQLVPL